MDAPSSFKRVKLAYKSSKKDARKMLGHVHLSCRTPANIQEFPICALP